MCSERGLPLKVTSHLPPALRYPIDLRQCFSWESPRILVTCGFWFSPSDWAWASACLISAQVRGPHSEQEVISTPPSEGESWASQTPCRLLHTHTDCISSWLCSVRYSCLHFFSWRPFFWMFPQFWWPYKLEQSAGWQEATTEEVMIPLDAVKWLFYSRHCCQLNGVCPYRRDSNPGTGITWSLKARTLQASWKRSGFPCCLLPRGLCGEGSFSLVPESMCLQRAAWCSAKWCGSPLVKARGLARASGRCFH